MSPVPAPRPVVAISLGDPSGIGPEVTAAALNEPAVWRSLTPVVFGDDRVWSDACARVGAPDRLARFATLGDLRGPSLITVTALAARDRRPGHPTAAGGRAQLAYLARATEVLAEGRAAALCTAPLSKAQVARAGEGPKASRRRTADEAPFNFSGHTEYLAARFDARVVMLLAGPRLRVAVHTTHIALSDVPRRIDGAEIEQDLKILDRELRERFGIARPRIAVCALNPHAGEGGLFGDEEGRVIAPAIARARRRRIDARGPFAADGLFPRAAAGEFDVVLAMYHDQGLIPLKLLDFDEGVNVTLGLPRPRTSPDHGVAYDLAGTGKARPDSMRAALLLAARMATGGKVQHRRGFKK